MTVLFTPPSQARQFDNWIDGAWVPGDGPETVVVNPASGQAVTVLRQTSQAMVNRACRSAHDAFGDEWGKSTGEQRANVLLHAAAGIRANLEELAWYEMVESGKPYRQARAEIERSAMLWDYASTQARSLTGDSFAGLGRDYLALTMRVPIGVAAIITPWNFPFLIVSQKLPFALAAGCSVVVKPSEMTSATTLLLGPILKEAGLPDGACNFVTGSGRGTGEALLRNPLTGIISFTGSTGVGKHAMKIGADGLKKVSLELGGKNAHIVMNDADLDAALDAALHGAFLNAGQSCNQGGRLLLQKGIAADFTRRFVDAARKIPVGDTLRDDVLVGPIINETQYRKILSYIEIGKSEGATLALGGTHREENGGRYIDPTVFTGVAANMQIAQEEIFGPVCTIQTFDTLEEAFEIANGTEYGLSAGIWTANTSAALQAARRLEAGTVWVNTYLDGPAELPFGGVGASGIGREVGRLGCEEFMDIKTVQFRSGNYQTRWIGKAI
ncbi:aldehyde dehydrogenase family protein [Phyllobacterium endophyticum]|uniref:Sorbosone dehydrogenase n=1 Tax=Phyllobacterium endophyticum TaxID=1149773 RepID=A0A2P7AS87_9HYPH|nr:aldehyde dehydrogenase family protein [Phyllobacterium endophyticum]MBB3236763.1 betaine-aldehyde dehydrogenase [Phyllobacterium endophyticum]PSH57040.1 sorbosone dehydrogenase [Phyllobacterium endophyticum]TYR40319.1 aldehyde dehydrogenase family protein [Phyllobacterium endophyticum]